MKTFESILRVEAPIERVWEFYTDLKNLRKITPPSLGLEVVKADLPLRRGSRVVFRAHVGPFPVEWEAVIREFDPPRRFSDEQARGPFDYWSHTHEFEPLGETAARVRDTIRLRPPLGLFGRGALLPLLEREIHSLFRYRAKKIHEILEGRHSK